MLLRDESNALKSLTYFKPQFMSLVRPHPLFTTAGNSSYNIMRACCQARMLSGRYRSQALLRHWRPQNTGLCLLSDSCNEMEDLPHILQRCVALKDVRKKLQDHTNEIVDSLPDYVREIVLLYCNSESQIFCDFMLDCSALPLVISAVQSYGDEVLSPLFDLTQTWLFVLHRERLKLLGRWKASGYWQNF